MIVNLTEIVSNIEGQHPIPGKDPYEIQHKSIPSSYRERGQEEGRNMIEEEKVSIV